MILSLHPINYVIMSVLFALALVVVMLSYLKSVCEIMKPCVLEKGKCLSPAQEALSKADPCC